MIGILVILAISWLLLYLLIRKNLMVLGFEPMGKRVLQLSTGVLLAGVLCALTQIIEITLSGASITWNDDLYWNSYCYMVGF